MKKIIPAIAICAAAASALIGCTPKPAMTELRHVEPPPERSVTQPGPDGAFIAQRFIERFIGGIEGSYSIEYVHYPFGAQKDELDYNIELRGDNTYDMRVTAGGVYSEHSGHWYSANGQLTLFYDEDTEETAHNVWASDCMCADIIDGGRFMIYDCGNVIVLSRNTEPHTRIMLPKA